MAGRIKKAEYKSVAVVHSIKATSRASVKIGESFYTLEYCEERLLPEQADIEKERQILWDVVNTECDNQVREVYEYLKK